jgi:hypothetical protein
MTVVSPSVRTSPAPTRQAAHIPPTMATARTLAAPAWAPAGYWCHCAPLGKAHSTVAREAPLTTAGPDREPIEVELPTPFIE